MKTEVTVTEAIATEEVTECFFCRIPGQQLYSGLSDRLCGVPGEWRFLRCLHCGLVWLSPRPMHAEISKIYETYHTHGEVHHWMAPFREKARRALYAASVPGYSGLIDGWVWKAAGTVLARLPFLKERAELGTMCLNAAKKGKLLDIGCGNGFFLAWMRDAGWEVTGIEPDPVAAKVAQERHGISVIAGTLEDAKLPNESFEAITLHHVIEHVYDPVALLSECRRLLKPCGKVVVATPNLESHGHKAFGGSWRGLEPPRHFYLFSHSTLKACCEIAGLHVEILRTTAQAARMIWEASENTRTNGGFFGSALTSGLGLRALAFQLREHRALSSSNPVGEELVLIGSPARSN